MARYVFAIRLSVRGGSVNATFYRKISLPKTRLHFEIHRHFCRAVKHEIGCSLDAGKTFGTARTAAATRDVGEFGVFRV
jgi:hypothetical protein